MEKGYKVAPNCMIQRQFKYVINLIGKVRDGDNILRISPT